MNVLGALLFGAGIFAIAMTLRLRDYGPNRVFGSFLDRWSTTLRIIGGICLVLAVLVAILGAQSH